MAAVGHCDYGEIQMKKQKTVIIVVIAVLCVAVIVLCIKKHKEKRHDAHVIETIAIEEVVDNTENTLTDEIQKESFMEPD